MPTFSDTTKSRIPLSQRLCALIEKSKIIRASYLKRTISTIRRLEELSKAGLSQAIK
jgi:hypothetical protein